ncbi:MAG: DegV family protein [Anaerolineae bacterium]
MIAVVSESVDNLPASVAAEYGITQVPYLVIRDGKELLDGVTVQAADLYRDMRQGPLAVSTSFPAPGAYVDAYRKAAAGADGIVSCHLSSALSGGYGQAVVAAGVAEVPCPIRPVDTHTVSMAQGFVALAAARAARAGATLEQVHAAAIKARDEVFFIAAFDTLEYLFRGGRLKRSAYVIGSALHFKPIIAAVDGALKPQSRVRNLSKGIGRLAEVVIERAQGKKLHLGAVHADNRAGAEQLRNLVARQVQMVESYIEDITPALGCHAGPGIVGACLWAEG